MYAVMSCTAAQHVPEFGVRMALGASPRQVLALVLGGAARLTAAGVGIGVVLAFSVGRVMDAMLFGLKSTDGLTSAGVLLALTPIIVLAAAVPGGGRRASTQWSRCGTSEFMRP
jgi:ABC-type antimicrobial peptide transport system permease subunit